MTPRWTLPRLPIFLDVIVALLFGVLWVFAEVGRVRPLVDGDGVGGYVLTLGPRTLWVWLGLYVIAIALCRILPVASVVIVATVPALQIIGILGPPESTNWPIYGATLYVAVALGATASRRLARAALVLGIVQAIMVAVAMVLIGDWVSWTGQGMTILGSPGPGIRAQWLAIIAVTAVVFYLAAWGAGFLHYVFGRRALEATRLRLAERDLQDATAELTGVKERAAIAQEVHDVLAHSLAVVIAVADGTRFVRATRPEATDEALRDIADTARTALVDLRGFMEELTDSAPRPQPGLGDLDELRARVSAAGVVVSIEHFGEQKELRPTQQLSVYRIVQEGLTNALKHAGDSPTATVALDWRGRGLSLVIRSSGRRAAAGDSFPLRAEGRSFGIEGMKDRARLAGGWLTAESETSGSFVVTAFVPVPDEATVSSAEESA